jgi:predicted amidohydrolase YtcJ
MMKQRYNNLKTFVPQKIFHFLFILLGLSSKYSMSQATIHTATKIYVCDSAMSTVECFVEENGWIRFTGSVNDAQLKYPTAKTTKHNGYLYPGLIDAHCHFLAYCRGTKEVNVFGTKSKSEVYKKVKKFKTKRTWIVGRGWDQNDWSEKTFPAAVDLKGASKKPVCLSRVDGHAIWVNDIALKTLNLNWDTIIAGGEIIKDASGKPTGIFVDNASDWVRKFIPPMDEKELTKAVVKQAKTIYKYGLTTLDEAGLELDEMNYLQKLQKDQKIHMRFCAMLSGKDENLIKVGTNEIPNNYLMHCESMKIYLDGALGSKGALLKTDYCDRNGYHGLQLMSYGQFSYYTQFLLNKNFQVCVHAIGDSANKLVINNFKQTIPEGFDARWRIEHAQIVDPRDQKQLSNWGIIPSIQPTHATSDAPWALSRLCVDSTQRIGYTQFYNPQSGAYAYKDLLKSAGVVAIGTDFPVEAINPFASFYSATQRMDIAGNLTVPFLPKQALSRKETLLGMTLWAAHANREDTWKGSIEANKVADFIVLDKDILECSVDDLKRIRAKRTFIGGKKMKH